MNSSIRLLIVALLILSPASAQYEDWLHSGTLHIDTTPNGADIPAGEAVEGFPILIRLHYDFFDLNEAASPYGEDLRFASADGTPLPYQIETFSRAAGTAEIWVRIPRIEGNAVQPVRIFWGKAGARDESDGAAVFRRDAGFAGVWHLGRDLDDAAGDLDGENQGTRRARGVIGGARRFGSGAWISCGDGEVDSLPSGNADRTMSAWVRPTSYNHGPTIAGWGKQGAHHLSYLTLSDRGRLLFHGYAADPRGVTQYPIGSWHHAMVTISGGKARFYFDGKLEHEERIRELGTSSPSACIIGRHTASSGRWARHFLGDLDEVRFAHGARSAAWARLSFENQKPLQTLVGGVVSDGDAFELSVDSLDVAEGTTTELHATIRGARKIYWHVRRGERDDVAVIDRPGLAFSAGRVDGETSASVVLRAVYPDGIREKVIPVTIREAIPDPAFTIDVPTTTWNGRDELVLEPVFTNLGVLERLGAARLRLRWTVDGPAVARTRDGDALVLGRAEGSGDLRITLRVDNGGAPVSETITIAVEEPEADPWVTREPFWDDAPTTSRFYARDATGYGTLWHNGSARPGTRLYLKVWGDDDLVARDTTTVPRGGRFRLSAKLKAGLVKYRTEFGILRDGEERPFHSADDIVCGDVYIIQGQSNAEAFDGGRAAHPHTSTWIRSYGSPRRDPAGARLRAWGDAVGFERDRWKLQIGYWGMELGKLLVEKHGIPVCILNGAQGGTRIDQHQRNDDDPTDVDTIYGRLLWRVREARLTHGVRAILWHQGENDQGSATGDGRWGHERYAAYFERMAHSWRRDYPNTDLRYVFQIWPRACAMGHEGSDDRLREVQRTLRRQYAGMSVMSTVGIRPPGGCHYPPEGYRRIAERIYPLVARDVHGARFDASITPPDVVGAIWVGEDRRAVEVQFDQDIRWSDELVGLFRFGDARLLVTTGTASGRTLVLELNGPAAPEERVSYLRSRDWNVKRPVLRGTNGIAALTFCELEVSVTK